VIDPTLQFAQDRSNNAWRGQLGEPLAITSLLRSRIKLAAQILVFVATLVTRAPCAAAANTADENQFRTFYDQFLAAVRTNDKTKIADLMEFPVNAWAQESKGNVQEIVIPSQADFLAKYDSLFTPFMRSHALKTKPQKISNDHYAVIWDGADVEYSFEFEYAAPHGFRLTSYLIGPR
jgi:hypothetical protein